MSKEDFEINFKARNILVANRFDTDMLTAKSIGQILNVEGFAKLEDRDLMSASPTMMDNLDKEFRGIDGIKRIRYRLENYLYMDGQWRQLKVAMKRDTIKIVEVVGDVGLGRKRTPQDEEDERRKREAARKRAEEFRRAMQKARGMSGPA